MKLILLLIFCTSTLLNGYSQIEHKNWLVGGVGNYTSFTTDIPSGSSETFTSISIRPDIGYFVIDNLALGINAGFNFQKTKSTNSFSPSTSTLGAGPFIRYYLLNKKRLINVLVHGSYNYFLNSTKNYSSTDKTNGRTYALEGGPVLFFNSSVGLELLLGWIHNNGNAGSPNIINVGLGFQIHLIK